MTINTVKIFLKFNNKIDEKIIGFFHRHKYVPQKNELKDDVWGGLLFSCLIILPIIIFIIIKIVG